MPSPAPNPAPGVAPYFVEEVRKHLEHEFGAKALYESGLAVKTTLDPTLELIQRRAALAEKKIELTSKLVEGAFEALMSGDAATHDAKVAAALKELSQQVDVIVLAQASMARVVDTLAPADKRVPILASPGIAVDYLATVL